MASTVSPVVRGRELFELHCAPCHGPAGRGQYIGETIKSPHIAGRSLSTITKQVRTGHGQMPTFGEAVISNEELGDLAAFVNGTLASPPPRPNLPPLGPSEVSPFVLGLIAWGALGAFCIVLATLFGPGRN